MSDALPADLPQIESAFQPILSLAHRAAVGYEALLRASHAGANCSPDAAFRIARRAGCYGAFERASASHHVERFLKDAEDDSVLFINLHPDVLVDPEHGPGFAADILASGLPPSRIVVEILEAREGTAPLADAVARLRQHGFLIALDDFGAGLTNLGRVWDLQPDVVKLDRELIQKAVLNYRNARSLQRLVDLLHDIGTFVVVEGVETQEQATLCLDCDVDFVQGYYFARPNIDLNAVKDGFPGLQMFENQDTNARKLRRAADLEEFAPYRHAFSVLQGAFCAGRSIAESAAHFLHLEWAVRVFVLDENGMQVGEAIESDKRALLQRTMFPLLERTGANWSKRAYFRNAVARAGETMVSEPYMSSASTNLCVTLSTHVRTADGGFVLCAEVLFEGLSGALR